DSAKNRKTKKQVRSRIQLSEDDVVAIFFSFDGIKLEKDTLHHGILKKWPI
uniref:Uncharacterized protein n=1 Tax=Aegilops tauschii subsp. strangulata TaxID=200361 RepID=A0A453CFE8_AEGTS